MKLLLNILAISLCALGALIGILFYLDNSSSIAVNFLGKPVAELQLALWLIGFFTVGCLTGWLIASAQSLKYRYQLSRSRKLPSDIATEMTATRAPLLNS